MSESGFSEASDRRVLGGFVFVDAITKASVVDPLRVTSAQLRLRANRSGVYAIFDAPGLRGLTTQFKPAAAGWPVAQDYEITVQDPSLRYLARQARVQAPQTLTEVFNPQRVPLYVSPSAVPAANWGVVRASVTGSDGRPLPWAALQVIRSDNTVAASGMADARGEALLAVMGLGVEVSADPSGAVTEATIPVTVQAWFDPSALEQPAGWIPNPDDILGNLTNPALRTGKQDGRLGAGQLLLTALTVSV